MKKGMLIMALVPLTVAMLIACGPAPTPAPAATAPPVPRPTVAAGWEVEWQKVVAEARKEGRISILTSLGAEVRTEVTAVLKDKFGIEAEFIAGRGTETAEKVAGERRAGLFTQDAYLGGVGTALTLLKPKGFLDPIDPVLVLPEVIKPEAWWEKALPYVDKDHTVFAYMAIAQQPTTINTEMVKSGEVKGWKDLLDPRWKGKIILDDPTVTGKGSMTISVANDIMGRDYVRQLARQDIAITRDKRLHVEWIARGKYPIGLGVDDSVRIEFQRAGAPVKNITPTEGTYVSASSGALSIFNRPAHPNATKLLTNWVLSQEGQVFLSKVFGFQSARADVPTDHLAADELRISGIQYLNTLTEEYRLKEEESRKMARELFFSAEKK